MMFVCEEHRDKFGRDTGCPYCRERKLANIKTLAQVVVLNAEWDGDISYVDTDDLQALRAALVPRDDV